MGPIRQSPESTAPAAGTLKVSSVCPACGRRPAVVFPAVRPTATSAGARLVCLACCPPVPAACDAARSAFARAYAALVGAERARDREIAAALPSASN